jgi:hypothetical protein
MKFSDIAKLRLINQQIAGTKYKKPAEIVEWLAGIQAQVYTSAKWAIGSRLHGITDADVEQSVTDKKIIRTWLMRGTLHIVSAKDIRWMLSLLAPRIIAGTASRNRQLELDDATFSRSIAVITKVLKNETQLTRSEIGIALKKAGIDVSGQRFYHILHRASLEQIICFGPKQGNEFTFTLLDKCVPLKKLFNRDDAISEITLRYFKSRGPATLQDFTAWSGLSVTDARTGIETAQRHLLKENIDGEDYWMPENTPTVKIKSPTAYLLAGFDEYLIAYRDRSACLDPYYGKKLIIKNGIFNPAVVIDGHVVGAWKPVVKKDKVAIQTDLFTPLSKQQINSISSAGRRYSEFAGIDLLQEPA